RSVGKPHMLEFDSARAMRFFCDRRRGDFHRSIEQLEYAFTGGHGGLQNVVLVAQVLDGTEEALRVAHKGDQNAERRDRGDCMNHRQVVDELQSDRGDRPLVKDSIASEPDDAGNGDVRKNFNDRVIKGVGEDGVLVRLHVAFVDFGKLAEGALFAVEQLQHHHSTYVLLQVRIDARDGNADAPVRVADAITEELGGNGNKREHREGDECKLPVHGEHDGDDSGQHEYIFKNRDHA